MELTYVVLVAGGGAVAVIVEPVCITLWIRMSLRDAAPSERAEILRRLAGLTRRPRVWPFPRDRPDQ